MLIKAPTTTAQPQPPSGGVQPTGPPVAGGIFTHAHADDDDEEEKDQMSFKHTGSVCEKKRK